MQHNTLNHTDESQAFQKLFAPGSSAQQVFGALVGRSIRAVEREALPPDEARQEAIELTRGAAFDWPEYGEEQLRPGMAFLDHASDEELGGFVDRVVAERTAAGIAGTPLTDRDLYFQYRHQIDYAESDRSKRDEQAANDFKILSAVMGDIRGRLPF